MAEFDPSEFDAEPRARSREGGDAARLLQLIYAEMVSLKHAQAQNELARQDAEARAASERQAWEARLAELTERLEASAKQRDEAVENSAERLSTHLVEQVNARVIPAMRATAEAVGEGQIKALERGTLALEDATKRATAAQATQAVATREALERVTGVGTAIGRVARTLRRGRDALGALAFLGVAAFVILVALAALGMAHLMNAQPTRVGGGVAVAALLAVGLGVSWLFSRFLPYAEDD